jgi:threonine dehydrogenase-like Zn-dependent dehydrogenase
VPTGAGEGSEKQAAASRACAGSVWRKPRARGTQLAVGLSIQDLTPSVPHQRKLDDIVEAYDLFSNQRDGVLKIAIKP